MSNEEEILKLLFRISSMWKFDEEYGKSYNQNLGVTIKDDYAELLTNITYNLKGTSGKSHGFDHNDKSETKVVNIFQPKFCNSGGNKICHKINDTHKLHYAMECCDLCGESVFIEMEDSRASIDTIAHFNQNVPRYIIWILLTINHVVTLKGYIIDSKDQFFNEVLEIQKKGGKKCKNFMPYSIEWYMSNPLKFAEYQFTNIYDKVEVEEKFFDIDNPISEIIEVSSDNNPVKKDIFNKKGDIKNQIFHILGKRNRYTYEELKNNNLIKITWNSKVGKLRGITKRREQ